jgi:tetratricopeptide (TPR) repeat protein
MDDSGSRRESFDELFIQGTGLLQAGKPSEAMVALESAHEARPDHIDAALNLSGAYILNRRFRKAVPLLEKLSQAVPDNEMVWLNLGAAYLGNPVLAGEKERASAIAAFKRAHEIDPAAPNVAYNIGLVYRDQNDNDEAIFWFREAVKSDPGDRHARDILRKLIEGERTEGGQSKKGSDF